MSISFYKICRNIYNVECVIYLSDFSSSGDETWQSLSVQQITLFNDDDDDNDDVVEEEKDKGGVEKNFVDSLIFEQKALV